MTSTESSTKELTGHPAMHAWNPTWKQHDIPRWAQKPMRAYIKWRQACGVDRDYTLLPHWLKRNFGEIVDHWGSIEDSTDKRVLVMCSYNRRDDVAAKLAEVIGARVWTCAPRGPWHPSTFLYTFNP